MQPYDATVRAITSFFAALIGFGLSHLLNAPGDLAPQKTLLFLIAVLLFLRFLTGSANHLWLEYVQRDAAVFPVLVDIIFLVGFGIIACFVCYSPTLGDFLYWSRVLLGAAVAWGVLGQLIPGPEEVGEWRWWILIDSVHLIAFFVLKSALVWLCVVGFVLCIVDFWVQLTNVNRCRRSTG